MVSADPGADNLEERRLGRLKDAPDNGTMGAILGDIFGRNAGDAVADDTPCLFFPVRTALRDSIRLMLDSSGVSICGVVEAVRGVLDVLSLADLADIVGVV